MSDFIDYGSVNARVAAFDARNNTDGPGVIIGGHRFFPSGGYRDVNPMGVLMDPPADDQERCKNIVAYHDEVLRRAIEAFQERKTFYANYARAVQREHRAPPPPCAPEQAATELKALQKTVKEAQARATAAREQLASHKPERLRLLEAQSDRNKVLAGELLNAVDAIQI